MNQDNRVEIKTLALAGGISRQPAHERFPGQVQDATNAVFSVADGASKRPGSIFVAKISGLTTGNGSIYRLHTINRDANEKYLVVYAINTLLAWHVNGTPCDIVGLNAFGFPGGSQAADYFAANNATADQLRFLSINDYTVIANTTVPLGVTVTPSYTVTKEWENYDQMTAHTPTSVAGSTSINLAGDNSYHKTNADSAGAPAGYYLYSVSGNTFPTIQFADVGDTFGGNPKDWANSTPRGFKIRFEKRQDTFTGATYTTATKRLVKTGNWAAYAHQPGDQVYISGGTGWTAGWKTIARKVSADELELAGSGLSASNGVNVAGGGIGQEYRVEFPGTGGQLPTMHDVALFIQGKLQAAGAADALVEWVDTGDKLGHFVITGPWRGSGAKITTVTTNPSDPGGGAFDLTAASQPLSPTGAVLVDGGGSGPRTLPVDQRWTRVAAPGDKDGAIDKTKAPIQMVRQSPAGSGSITGVSVANPTTLTTSAAHGLVPGQTVTIAGTNTSATTVGTFTVLDTPTPTTFRLSINVTSVTTGTGTFTSRPRFTYDFIDWPNRTSGTDSTNPSPKPFKEGRKISDLSAHRQRFMMAAGDTVMFGASGDLFRLYLDDAANVVDSDPIISSVSSDRVTTIDYLAPIRDSVLVTTLGGQQFALGAPDTLSPSTVTFARATNIQTLRVRPVSIDPAVYIAAAAGGKSQLREAMFIGDAIPADAPDVSSHVAGTDGPSGLLPAAIQTLAEHPNSRTVFVLPSPGANKLYLYRSFWSGNRKEQSAWSVWTFDAACRISDIAVIDDFLYLLIESANQWVIEKVPVFEPGVGSYPYTLHIDRQMVATGSYNGGTGLTTWTLPSSLSDTTINTIVKQTGVVVPVVTAAGTTVTATGDHSGASCTLGRSYLFSVTLSEPFIRDDQGRAELALTLMQQRMVLVHANSGAYTVVLDIAAGTDPTFVFTPPSGFTSSAGQFEAWAGSDLSRASIRIESAAVTPTTIAGYTHYGEWSSRFH